MTGKCPMCESELIEEPACEWYNCLGCGGRFSREFLEDTEWLRRERGMKGFGILELVLVVTLVGIGISLIEIAAR